LKDEKKVIFCIFFRVLSCICVIKRASNLSGFLVERLSSSLEIITEPHKLTASLHSMVGVARCLIAPSSFYPQGRTQVLPLLFATLPGKRGFLLEIVLKIIGIPYFLGS
jgi:hypothetical protein